MGKGSARREGNRAGVHRMGADVVMGWGVQMAAGCQTGSWCSGPTPRAEWWVFLGSHDKGHHKASIGFILPKWPVLTFLRVLKL